MPAAPTYEKLLDIQANVEASLAAYLTANGLASIDSRSTVDIPDARIVVMVDVGAAQGHCTPVTATNTGQQEEDWFAINITFQIQTDRATVAASPVAGLANVHDYWVARLKKLMLRGALAGTLTGVTPLDLGYYSMATLTFSGDLQDVSDEALDLTTTAYAAQLRILPDSWPAAD